MTREEKSKIIEATVGYIKSYSNFYITDATAINAEKTTVLRQLCFNSDVKIVVIKNTLLKLALIECGITDEAMFSTLVGNTTVMFSESLNAPAKIIKEFRKSGNDKPLLKSAYVQESIYVGDSNLDALIAIKGREELLGDIIGLLQSPIKNVVSALNGSAGQKIAGIVKALEKKAA